MYRHAPKFRRPASHDLDQGEVFVAAGVSPPGTPEFVRQVEFAVLEHGIYIHNLSALAHYVNGKGVRNARGHLWTRNAIKAFVEHYMPTARIISN